MSVFLVFVFNWEGFNMVDAMGTHATSPMPLAVHLVATPNNCAIRSSVGSDGCRYSQNTIIYFVFYSQIRIFADRMVIL